MNDSVSALRRAIDGTLTAIAEGRETIGEIARQTQNEVHILELQYGELLQQCDEAIAAVESLEVATRDARQRLLVVNRDIKQFTENDMQVAYDTAYQRQTELVQARATEEALRGRRDDLARRLRALRATSQQAEVLHTRFTHVTAYLDQEFHVADDALRAAQMQSVLILQLLHLHEEERRILAGRLHDGPMQSIASAAMRLQAGSGGAEWGEEEREVVRERLNSVIDELRQTVFDLRPPLLDDLGLVPTLKNYARQWSEWTGKNAIVLVIGNEFPLTTAQKLTTFRVAQEALRNVEQHAQATHVNVSMVYGRDAVEVQVMDNAPGFGEAAWDEWLSQGKLGLILCKQRLEVIQGTLHIGGGEKGTKLVIRLPAAKEGMA